MSKKLYSIEDYLTHNCTPTHRSFLYIRRVEVLPKSVHKALKDPKWKKSMDDALDAFGKNKLGHLKNLPSEKISFHYKLVSTIK